MFNSYCMIDIKNNLKLAVYIGLKNRKNYIYIYSRMCVCVSIWSIVIVFKKNYYIS